VVCCGGGGLLAGVASAVKLSGSSARVIGVEPEGADSMGRSVRVGRAQWMPHGRTDTIAHGLAPPFAGRACFNHVSRFVDQMVTVTDDELRRATLALFEAEVVAEVSGAAAAAAVMAGKVGDVTGKRVVCIVSGRNIGPKEFMDEVCGDA
jgi:threonine dehydratase